MAYKNKKFKNKLTTIEVYKKDKKLLDNLAKFRKENYRDILNRILNKVISLTQDP